MGLELEAAGEMLSTGLIAHEIDQAKGEGGDAKPAAHTCLNCKATFAGNFCPSCGQKAHLHSSVLHLGEELAHGILHFDTKGWRTLPMLAIRPGLLTRRYVDGQRTRFVSPLALFLFMMFLMFFVFSFTVGDVNTGEEIKLNGVDQFQAKLDQRKADLAEAEKELAAAVPGSEDAKDAQRRLDKAKRRYEATALVGKGARTAATEAPAVVTGASKELTDNINTNVPWLKNAVKHAVDNPELTKYKLKNAAYKYAFLLVPLSMPFLWLILFWKKTASMYVHAVFSLYSLSFMSLLMVVLALLSYADFGGTAVLLFFLIPPIHLYFQLRDTYVLKRWEALWRTGAMMFFAAIALTLYATVVLAISA